MFERARLNIPQDIVWKKAREYVVERLGNDLIRAAISLAPEESVDRLHVRVVHGLVEKGIQFLKTLEKTDQFTDRNADGAVGRDAIDPILNDLANGRMLAWHVVVRPTYLAISGGRKPVRFIG